MNGDSELVERIAKVVSSFGRKAERARLKLTGQVRECKGCGRDVVTKGQGRPRLWCYECMKPGGVKHEMHRAYMRAYYHKRKGEVQSGRDGGEASE